MINWKTKKYLSTGRRKVNGIKYADDMVLLANELEESVKKDGIKLIMVKTKVNDIGSAKVMAKKYGYLWSMLTADCKSEVEVKTNCRG